VGTFRCLPPGQGLESRISSREEIMTLFINFGLIWLQH
jgi:hypothetical protein